jgi:CheY-like chemotaxis protein
MRIAIVDDHRDSAELLALLLEARGEHEVRVFFDGATALLGLQGGDTDAAILDLNLPDMSGHELARQLRTLPACRRMRLLALTGSVTAGVREAARQAGFSAYLLKPVSIDTVLHALATDEAPRQHA